jgi:hypothetical protein
MTTEAEKPPEAAEDTAPEAPTIPFKEFLEAVHPSVERKVLDIWRQVNSSTWKMNTPELLLHCAGM